MLVLYKKLSQFGKSRWSAEGILRNSIKLLSGKIEWIFDAFCREFPRDREIYREYAIAYRNQISIASLNEKIPLKLEEINMASPTVRR